MSQAEAKPPEVMLAGAAGTVRGTFEEGRNLTHYVDYRWLPGKKRNLYYTNEGLLSTIPAVATTLFGIMAGWLFAGPAPSGRRKVARLLCAGAAGVALGMLWGLQVPIVKRIWTPSFCLVASGASATETRARRGSINSPPKGAAIATPPAPRRVACYPGRGGQAHPPRHRRIRLDPSVHSKVPPEGLTFTLESDRPLARRDESSLRQSIRPEAHLVGKGITRKRAVFASGFDLSQDSGRRQEITPGAFRLPHRAFCLSTRIYRIPPIHPRPPMRLPLISAWSASVLLACSGILIAAPEPDPLLAIKKQTEEFAAADKAAAGVRSALLAAREALDTTRFSSAAYNARISANGLTAAKDKYEKAAPEAKADALEAYELAQELDAQRKAALADAEKLLPQREAEAKAAEEKYATALAAAETAAGQIRTRLRESENAAQARLKDSKVAIEKAAFSQATAEQTNAANAAILKTLADFGSKDKALQTAAAAVQSAPENDRAPKLADGEKAVRAYAVALHGAAQHLVARPQTTSLLALATSLVEADQAVEKATEALQAAKQSVQEKTKAVTQTEERIKVAREGLENRIARIRAQKDIEREQEALKRAQAAAAQATQSQSAKAAELEKAQQAATAALHATVNALLLAPEPAKALADDKAAFAKAIAETEAAIKKENETSAREAATAQKAAEKARAELAAADKTAAQHLALRDGLQKVMRQRFFRDLRTAQDVKVREEGALAATTRELQTKTTTLNKASGTLKQAQDSLAKAQKDVASLSGLVATVAKDQQAAEKSAQEKLAARSAAEQKAVQAKAEAKAAQESLAQAAGEGRPDAEQRVKETEAAAQAAAKLAQQAADAAKPAQATLEKLQAALKAVEKRCRDAANTAKNAEQKAATAQAACDQATADRNAAEKNLAERRKAVDAATAAFAIAKAGSQGGLKLLPASAWDLAKARHLMVRAGFGGTPDELARLHALGLHGAVSSLVDLKKLPPAEVAFAAYPKERPENFENMFSNDDQRRLREQRTARDRKQIQEMRAWWLRRMIESPRPLEEKLTLFWHGQIPVQYTTVGDSYYMYLQNQLYRDNAAGNFATLLHGVAHDAAMLKYLNNDTNVKGRANENLAREIMELFSMGRDQGYSEIDIRQGARALTGYTYDATTGQFRFISGRHDTEPKTIFGKTANWAGDDFVDLILATPYPAKFIARQIFTFFVHDTPSIDTIEALAGVLRANNYELAPLLENLFLSEEFYSATAISTEIKSPVQLIVGLHRDLGLKSPDYTYLATATRDMGQELFEPPSVFGWQPGQSWITTSRILGRYNVLAEVLQSKARSGKAGMDVLGTVLAGKSFKDHGEVVDYLAKCLWVVPLSESKRQAFLEFLKPLPEPSQWAASADAVNARLTRLLVMLMCTPESQIT